ncbi:hypothetical protein BJ546DRAFT_221228 [Cryomyces antarcticus]
MFAEGEGSCALLLLPAVYCSYRYTRRANVSGSLLYPPSLRQFFFEPSGRVAGVARETPQLCVWRPTAVPTSVGCSQRRPTMDGTRESTVPRLKLEETSERHDYSARSFPSFCFGQRGYILGNEEQQQRREPVGTEPVQQWEPAVLGTHQRRARASPKPRLFQFVDLHLSLPHAVLTQTLSSTCRTPKHLASFARRPMSFTPATLRDRRTR